MAVGVQDCTQLVSLIQDREVVPSRFGPPQTQAEAREEDQLQVSRFPALEHLALSQQSLATETAAALDGLRCLRRLTLRLAPIHTLVDSAAGLKRFFKSHGARIEQFSLALHLEMYDQGIVQAAAPWVTSLCLDPTLDQRLLELSPATTASFASCVKLERLLLCNYELSIEQATAVLAAPALRRIELRQGDLQGKLSQKCPAANSLRSLLVASERKGRCPVIRVSSNSAGYTMAEMEFQITIKGVRLSRACPTHVRACGYFVCSILCLCVRACAMFRPDRASLIAPTTPWRPATSGSPTRAARSSRARRRTRTRGRTAGTTGWRR